MAKNRAPDNGEGSTYEQGRDGSAFGYRKAPINGHGSKRAILYARASIDE